MYATAMAQPLTFFIISCLIHGTVHKQSQRRQRNPEQTADEKKRKEKKKIHSRHRPSACCQSEKSALHIGAMAVYASPLHSVPPQWFCVGGMETQTQSIPEQAQMNKSAASALT